MTFTDWDGKKYLVKIKSYNILKTISVADTKYHYLCTYVDIKSNNVNPNHENIIAITLKLFHFSFLKIVKIEFKMRLRDSFFCLEFSQLPAKHEFL